MDRDDEGRGLQLVASEAETAEGGPGMLGVVATRLDAFEVDVRLQQPFLVLGREGGDGDRPLKTHVRTPYEE